MSQHDGGMPLVHEQQSDDAMLTICQISAWTDHQLAFIAC
jgi:hypothetical protein